MDTTSIGIDIAKPVFQASVVGSSGHVFERTMLIRAQFQRFLAEQHGANIVLDACATVHHWARTARADRAQVEEERDELEKIG